MKKILIIINTILLISICQSQEKRILFLGNSYTEANNLPQLLVDVANSTNDLILIDRNTPGGHTLQQHNSNATSLAKIAAGNWDFVVLQEQSQLPSFPINQVNTEVFPFAQALNTTIVNQNPCAETVFYMTWGRKNGDSQNCPFYSPVCTYEGMDDLLRERYLTMTTDNNAIVSPVGAVWRYLRLNNPSIELYSSDESHPSLLGSYAAACTFYTTITRKDPTAITYNSTLSSWDANAIKLAVKNVVFDHFINWKIGSYDPISSFTFANTTSNELNFTNNSTNGNSYLWDFGDGTSSTELNPTHIYTNLGDYTVILKVTKCGIETTSQQTITISNLSINYLSLEKNNIKLFPNPIKNSGTILSDDTINLVEIFDINGRLIEHLENDKKTIEIDFSTKTEGFYFLKIHSKEHVFTEKILKN